LSGKAPGKGGWDKSVIDALVQKSLDGPRYTMGVLQKKSVTGLFNQADFYIGEQRQQITGGFGGHQPIQAGKQMQLRAAKRLQSGTGIQLGKQFKARHQ
jgi:hypothetical protein